MVPVGENDYYVYVHKKPDGTIFYVGKGKKKRAWSLNRSTLWKRTTSKYGYFVEIVQGGLQEWYALELESELIYKYELIRVGGTLVNFSYNGTGFTNGRTYTEESRLKISRALTGKHRSLEHCRKLSEALKGWPKEGHSFYGKQHTTETRLKISKAKTGKNLGSMNPFAKSVRCIETGSVFGSVTEAAAWYRSIGHGKAHPNEIGNVLTGRYKQYLGYTWEYYNKKEEECYQ